MGDVQVCTEKINQPCIYERKALGSQAMDATEYPPPGPRPPFIEVAMSYSEEVRDALFYRYWTAHSQMGPFAIYEPLPMMIPLGPLISSV